MERLVGDDAHHSPVDPRQPTNDLPGVQLLDLEKAAFVDDAIDQVLHVEGAPFILGDKGFKQNRRFGIGCRLR